MDIQDLANDVMAQARTCGVRLVTAESCTAGRLAALLADAPGAGEHLHGGFVTYTKEMKSRVLAVDAGLLREKGAVCAEVAEAMARGALRASDADVAISVTGVTGPEPDEDGNPVGLVFCAVARRGAPQTPALRLTFGEADKAAILDGALRAALRILRAACEPAAHVA